MILNSVASVSRRDLLYENHGVTVNFAVTTNQRDGHPVQQGTE